MSRVLRLLSAVAVLLESVIFLFAVNYAAHHGHVHRPGYTLVITTALMVGLLSLAGVYFILVPNEKVG